MIFPQRMRRLNALVLQEDAPALTKKLLNLGVIDFVDMRELSEDLTSTLATEKDEASTQRLIETRQRIEMFLRTADINLPDEGDLDAEHVEPVDLDAIDARLDKLGAAVQAVRDEQQSVQQELHRTAELQEQIRLFPEITEISPSGSYAAIRAGVVGRSRLSSLKQALSGLPVYLYPVDEQAEEVQLLIMYMQRDADKVGSILDRMQWKTIDIPQELRGKKSQLLEDFTTRMYEAKRRQKELADKAQQLITQQKDELLTTWKHLIISERIQSIQSHYAHTARTVLVTGWIPARRVEAVEKCLRETTDGRSYIQWATPEEDRTIKPESVPVQLTHSKLLSPFQWLVENYSLPQYGTIDPTPLVAVTYLIMFGLMFGDAGHGVVLSLVGFLVLLWRRTSRSQQELAHDTPAKLASLIIWCGASAVVMGVLFGSYFGYQWFPPLWFDYHSIVSGHGGAGGPSYANSIYDILGITIRFGVAVIALGIILNCVNRIRSRQWIHLFFDTGGLLGGWFYAGGVWAGFFFVSSGYEQLPPGSTLFPAVGLPLLLFALKGPASFIAAKRSAEPGKQPTVSPSAVGHALTDWIVELLELVTGYLSNTLSFMRIAGLGIAHVSLMTAFFQIAETTGSQVGAVAVMILGNAIVIVLEGLSAGVQSLRLHYYEFFTKYFCGSGRVYRPVSLRRAEV
ncbi:MAG: V-type ATP synthase subunit I [Spirochaetota bacterium]